MYGLTVPGIKMLMATKERYDTERDVLEDQRRYDKNRVYFSANCGYIMRPLGTPNQIRLQCLAQHQYR